jgi:hypothetical protein
MAGKRKTLFYFGAAFTLVIVEGQRPLSFNLFIDAFDWSKTISF